MERPKLQLKLSLADQLTELLGWLAVLGLWIFTVLNFSKLPARIPTHYNALGKIDAYGSKGAIFILPIIGAVLFVGMSILGQFPHLFNYPVAITEENAERQYTNAARMNRVLKLVLVLIFLLIQFKIVKASADEKGLGIWFMPLMLALIFIPVLYFVVKSFRQK